MNRRSGTTLIEVLMSVMVMGIGVITVASLFAISSLRTARANQLTNAAILSRNADVLLRTYPHLLHDPDNSANYYTMNPIAQEVAEHYDTRYVVDPLGWWTHSDAGNGLEDIFGNDGTNPSASGLPRFHGGSAIQTVNADDPSTPVDESLVGFVIDRNAAAKWFTLPDSWIDVVDGPVDGQVSSGTSVDIDAPPANLAGITPSSAEYRVTLFESPVFNPRPGSLTRRLTAITGRTVQWAEPLPSGFDPERVRIEVREWMFSWFITVEKSTDGVATGSVVVVFRRSFDERDELVYQSAFTAGDQANGLTGWDRQPGVAGVDDDNDMTIDNPSETGTPGSDDTLTGYIFWDSSQTEPQLGRGKFIFDLGRARWYQIRDFRIETNPTDQPQPPAGTDMRATLLFDREVVDSTGGATLMKNVIAEFPLAESSVDQANRVR